MLATSEVRNEVVILIQLPEFHTIRMTFPVAHIQMVSDPHVNATVPPTQAAALRAGHQWQAEEIPAIAPDWSGIHRGSTKYSVVLGSIAGAVCKSEPHNTEPGATTPT